MSITQFLRTLLKRRDPEPEMLLGDQAESNELGFSELSSNADDENIPLTPATPVDSSSKRVFGKKSAKRERTPSTGSAPYLLVGTVAEVQALRDQPPAKRTAIIFSGDLVMLADEGLDATVLENDATYHRQTDRIVKPLGSITRRKRGTQHTLKVWLHEEAIALRRALPRHRFAFALDQYLAYGRSQQQAKLHLITGHAAHAETVFHIFTFEDGALTNIEEKVLVDQAHFRFETDYASLLSSYERNGYTLVIADPLPNAPARFANADIRYLGADIYHKPISYFVVDGDARPSFVVRHGLSMALATAAFGIYALALAIPYNDYNEATIEFRRLAGTIPEKDLAFGSDQLKTMQERRLFMDEKRGQDESISFLRSVAQTLASGGNIIIKKLSLNAVKTQPTDPDVAIVIDTKRSPNPGVTLLDQAKPILDRLSQRLGMDFHLAHNGFQERNSTERDNSKVLSFTIEGDLKRGQQ